MYKYLHNQITRNMRWFKVATNKRANNRYSLVFTCSVNLYWAGILGRPNSSTPMPSCINN